MIKNNKSFESSTVASVIAESFQIEGIIKTDVSIEINGKVDGEIISNSTILVGEKAVINANISCAEIIIAGTINGNVTAKKRIMIKSKGKLIGEVKTKLFVIDDGGTFLGTSDMNVNFNNINNDNENKHDNNNNYDKNEGNNDANNDNDDERNEDNSKDKGKKGKSWWQKI